MNDLIQRFNEFELKYKDMRISQIPCWHVFRMSVFNELQNAMLGFRVLHPDLQIENKKTTEMISAGFRLAVRGIKDSFWTPFVNGRPYLVSCGARKGLYKGRLLNRCTAPLIDAIPEKLNYIEKSSLYAAGTATDYRVAYTDWAEIKRFINQKTKKYRFSSADITALDALLNDLALTFDVPLDCSNVCKRLQYIWNGFCTYYFHYRSIIPRLRPTLFIAVDHYSTTNLAFTKIAHENRIPVVELQHGCIGENHIAYNYRFSDIYTPDYFYTYGRAWGKRIAFPTNCITVGNAYLEESIKTIPVKPDRNNLIILSQGPYARELLNLTMQLLANEEFKKQNIRIIYKLHPNEYHSWKKIYPELQRADITVIDSPNDSLYELFSRCSIQIGVDSTALYEGFAFQLKTLVLLIDGVHPDNCLLENGGIAISNADDAVKEMKKPNTVTYDPEVFWKKNAQATLIDNLENLARRTDLNQTGE